MTSQEAALRATSVHGHMKMPSTKSDCWSLGVIIVCCDCYQFPLTGDAENWKGWELNYKQDRFVTTKAQFHPRWLAAQWKKEGNDILS